MQRAEQCAIFIFPRRGRESLSGGSADGPCDVERAVHIADAEFEDACHIAHSRQILRGGQRGKRPVGVVIVKTGVEHAGHAKTARARHHAVGSQPAFGTREGE